MPVTQLFHEANTTCGFIGANAGTAGIFLSDAVKIDCTTAGRVLVAAINTGTIGSSGTVDAKLRWSATSGGTYADITNAAMVQNVAGSRVDLIVAAIEKIKANYPLAVYVKLSVTTAVAATPFGAIIFGMDATPLPVAAGADLGTVTVYAG